MAVKTYDPKKFIVTLGTDTIVDWVSISVTPAGDRFTKNVGADGEVTRTKSNDYTDEVVITLNQSSSSNDVLSQIAFNDRFLGTSIQSLSITDIGGSTITNYPEAWIKQEAAIEVSNELGERAWTLDTGQPTTKNVGGNL
jgi:hypothetical protein